jgi:hypothetical protein
MRPGKLPPLRPSLLFASGLVLLQQRELSSQSTAGVTLCCAFYQPQQNVPKCHFAAPNRHVLTFLIYFNLQGIILSTSGVALPPSHAKFPGTSDQSNKLLFH